MSTLLVWKEKLQLYYGKYTSVIDKTLKFILGLLVFLLINSNVGFMKTAASPLFTVGLAVICAFLPFTVMTFLAAGLILLHLYSLSMPVALITGMVFLIMYIFYFRFTPQKAWLVLLTPLAFALKVPYVIPVAYGLIGTPVYVVPVTCGTIIYYMLHYVKTSSAALKGSGTTGMITSLSTYAKQIFQNKEMIVMILAFALCLLLVYNIRTRSADHAWKLAIAAGVICNVIVIVIGVMVFRISPNYLWLILGSALAAIVGMALEILFFSVNYAGAQQVQFEDDEYYYYVKAIPKIAVSAPEKTVKKINERQESTEQHEPQNGQHVQQNGQQHRQQNGQHHRGGDAQEEWSSRRTEEELLKQSLNKELGIGHEREQ